MAWHPDGKRLAIGYFWRDEVEVWDVATKKPLFKVPSQRKAMNESGQEVAFSPDGKYLVVQDFKDLKVGGPAFPRSRDDPLEPAARADKGRYLLARVWNLETHKEIAQLEGPGAVLYGGVQRGFCWTGGSTPHFAMQRNAVVVVYDVSTGTVLHEVDLGSPFADHPEIKRGYLKMACHPTKPLVAMQGGRFLEEATLFGFVPRSGATPIVVADIEKRAVVKVLYTPTPLNGVIWTADGSKLFSFGAPPIRIWDATKDFAPAGEIWQAKGNSDVFARVPGFDGVMGIADAIYLWDAKTLKSVARTPSPGDTLRAALHASSSTVAIASGRFAHLFKFNIAALNAPQ